MDSGVLDLTFLTETERNLILQVLNRDDEIQKREDERIARLKSKAARTNNPVIQKKIKMRTGAWFFDLMQPTKAKTKSGRDTIRASIRKSNVRGFRQTRSPAPPPPAPFRVDVIVEEPAKDQYSTHTDPEPQDRTIPYAVETETQVEYVEDTPYPDYSADDRPSYGEMDDSYSSDLNRDKVEELSSAMSFLQTLENHDDGNVSGKQKKSHTNLMRGYAKSLPSLSKSRLSLTGSTWSVYSAAAHDQTGIDVTGTIELGFSYGYKTGTLNVHVIGCANIAAVDEKKLSNPYVKTYLLPDKHSKRKTKTKKHTISPVYNEALKYVVSETALATRTLNVAVWHDKVGVNTFLGEVNLSCNALDLSTPVKTKEYDLLPKNMDALSSAEPYTGDMNLSVRYMPANRANATQSRLEIVLKDVNNIPSKSSNPSNVYIKGYLLPDKLQDTKQKTPLTSCEASMSFDHLFVFTGVERRELESRCAELTVHTQGTFGKTRLIGGVRLGAGTGVSFDKPVTWMDSRDAEVDLWRRMIKNEGSWVTGNLLLRCFEPRK